MQKRYWLKGGIIGALIWIVAMLVKGIPLLIIFILSFPILALPFVNYGDSTQDPLINAITLTVYGFLFGAFIGWIYGKIKNRNNKVELN